MPGAMSIEMLRELASELPAHTEGHPHSWNGRRTGMRDHLLHDNPLDFTHWSTVTATMFAADCEHVRAKLPLLNPRFQSAAREHPFGAPTTLPDHSDYSGASIIQAFYLQTFEQATGRAAARFQTVVEFGGGYGKMRHIFHRLGFRGHYHIFDLPEMALLQEFYLSNLGLDAHYHVVDDQGRFPLPPHEPDLLIAAYSLSEVSRELRSAFFDTCHPRYALIVHQDAWDGVDMNKEMDIFCSARHEYQHRDFQNPGLPSHTLRVLWRKR